jgi:hypothetical protein
VSSGLLASSLFIIAPQSLGQELPIVAPHRLCAVRFAINAKAADEALIEFAKQAELTIVFPFNKVKESVSNALYYCY